MRQETFSGQFGSSLPLFHLFDTADEVLAEVQSVLRVMDQLSPEFVEWTAVSALLVNVRSHVTFSHAVQVVAVLLQV